MALVLRSFMYDSQLVLGQNISGSSFTSQILQVSPSFDCAIVCAGVNTTKSGYLVTLSESDDGSNFTTLMSFALAPNLTQEQEYRLIAITQMYLLCEVTRITGYPFATIQISTIYLGI